MLYYPKIPGSKNCPDGKCIAFEKYDGTNLHWTWDAAHQHNGGWSSFGTRRDGFPLDEQGIAEFASAHPEMADTVDLFFASAAAPLVRLVKQFYPSAQHVVCFAEYLDPGSFAGLHKVEDSKELILFDVQVDGSIVGPDEFVANFVKARDPHLKVARVVYQGKLTGKFAEDVRNGRFGVTEGVVCKGLKGSWMAKVKPYEYMERLKRFDPKNWEQYWE